LINGTDNVLLVNTCQQSATKYMSTISHTIDVNNQPHNRC